MVQASDSMLEIVTTRMKRFRKINVTPIYAFVRMNFNSVQFMYFPRGCNMVAHALGAIGASRCESRRLWLENVPDSVLVLVAGDSTEPLK